MIEHPGLLDRKSPNHLVKSSMFYLHSCETQLACLQTIIQQEYGCYIYEHKVVIHPRHIGVIFMNVDIILSQIPPKQRFFKRRW